MLKRPTIASEVKNEKIVLPVKLNMVFTITLCLICAVGAKAPLKLGQNTHKNIVPIIAKRFDVYDDF